MPSQYQADMPAARFLPPPPIQVPAQVPVQAPARASDRASDQAGKTPAATETTVGTVSNIKPPASVPEAAEQGSQEQGSTKLTPSDYLAMARAAAMSSSSHGTGQPGQAGGQSNSSVGGSVAEPGMSPASDARRVRIILNQLATFGPMLGALVRTGTDDQPRIVAEMLEAHRKIATQVVGDLGLSDHPATLAQIGRGIASLVATEWGRPEFSEEMIARRVVDLVRASSGYDADRAEYNNGELDELMSRCRVVTTLSTASKTFEDLPEGVRRAIAPPEGQATPLIASLARRVTTMAESLNDNMLAHIGEGAVTISPADRNNSLKAWRNHVSQLMADSLTYETTGLVDRLIGMNQEQRVAAVEQAGTDGLLFQAVITKAEEGIEQMKTLAGIAPPAKLSSGPRPG